MITKLWWMLVFDQVGIFSIHISFIPQAVRNKAKRVTYINSTKAEKLVMRAAFQFIDECRCVRIQFAVHSILDDP